MKIEEQKGKLVITEFDEIEAYQIACTIEKEGIRFYTKLSNQQNNVKVKEMLEFMVQDERNHLKFFESSLDDLTANLNEADEDNDLIESMDFGIFQPYESIEHIEEIVSDSKKALKLGIVSEKKAIDFYTQCRNKIHSESTKKELDKIIAEENKHKSLFEKMLHDLS